MPRQSRLDAPAALHHIIIRGIERKKIFGDNRDKDWYLERLGMILEETETSCYAWVLMDNHAHILLRTGVEPISTVMRRLLTGYAQYFNRRYDRHGHLFHNRYKSIICEEEPYLLELVRYIHLNPKRAGMVNDLRQLRYYKYSGHGVIAGGLKGYEWQDRGYVLGLFDDRERRAVKAYVEFVSTGIPEGERPDLMGGGLIRSFGGWDSLKEQKAEGKRINGDERILGNSDFVDRVLKKAKKAYEKKTLMKSKGMNFNHLLNRVLKKYELEKEDLKGGRKKSKIVKARTVLCYLGVNSLGMSCVEISRELDISPSTVSKLVYRGKEFKEEIRKLS